EGGRRVARKLVPERQRALGGQLHHETVRQGLDGVFLLVIRLDGLSADANDRPLAGTVPVGIARRLAVTILATIGGRSLVLGLHIAAVDEQRAVGIDADENAGARDIGRIVADGTGFQ